MNFLLTRIVLAVTLMTQASAVLAEISGYKNVLNITDRIVVYFQEKPTKARALAFIKHGVTHGGYGVAVGKRREVLEIGAPVNVQEAAILAESLEDDPQVKFAEPDFVMFTMRAPNDPLYKHQWHYFDAHAGINLPAGWEVSTGSTQNIIGVLDTGTTNHNDMAGRLVPGYDFISDPWMANDGDGWDSNPEDTGDALNPGACGTIFGEPVPVDAMASSWHGTHVTGTIAAGTNNRIGTSGVSWHSKVQPLRVLGRCGGYISDIVAAMRWGAGLQVFGLPINRHPASTLNMSLGTTLETCPKTYQQTINEIVDAGVTIVVAAGNEQADVAMTSPANCKNIIVVGAINRLGHRSSYSNFGSGIDIMAPGGDPNVMNDGIISLYNTGLDGQEKGSYAGLYGTSMAAPHISGLIDLSYAINPNLSPFERKLLLQQTAKPFKPNSNCSVDRCGSGIADAAAFLRAVQRK